MASAMDHLMASQKEWTKSEGSATTLISYKHISGTIVQALDVFKEKAKFNDTTKGNGREDTIIFTNVVLAETPTNNDTIVCEDITYSVKEWYYEIGMYVIQAVANKRHSVSLRA